MQSIESSLVDTLFEYYILCDKFRLGKLSKSVVDVMKHDFGKARAFVSDIPASTLQNVFFCFKHNDNRFDAHETLNNLPFFVTQRVLSLWGKKNQFYSGVVMGINPHGIISIFISYT